jgi:hypothetical protein
MYNMSTYVFDDEIPTGVVKMLFPLVRSDADDPEPYQVQGMTLRTLFLVVTSSPPFSVCCHHANIISGQTGVVSEAVSVVFEWDMKLYPPTDYEAQQSPDGRTYRRLRYAINIAQGPAKMEFSYSIDGVVRGKAQSVEYTSSIVTYAAS